MKKFFLSNIMFKLISLVLAVITWFYISGEMRRQALIPAPYSTNKK